MVVHGFGSLSGNTGFDSFVNNAEVNAQCIRLGKGQIRQG
jgi:hypothetical protein